MFTEKDLQDLAEYEIFSSWWAGWVSNPRLQILVGKYFAWKVQRKFRQYKQNQGIRIDWLNDLLERSQ